MESVEHILVATDGSELSLKAAALGGTLARALGAKVSILMVIDIDIVVAEAWGGDLTEDARRDIENKISSDEIERTAKAVGHLPAEPARAVVIGNAGDQICEYARENGVDLIIMGSHGRTGIKRAFLGSASYSVVNQATCAVTVVR